MSKRAHCPTCNQVLARCFCDHLARLENISPILILQHPQEVKHAKNTAGFLHQSLAHSQLLIGETFDSELLTQALYKDSLTPILLYPPTTEADSLGIEHPPEFKQTLAARDYRLVILDATWRKSRKMLYLNKALHGLPRLGLTDTPLSLYRIRKADSENQLSTLEASCYALAQLAPETNIAPILSAFTSYIDYLAKFYPHASPHSQNNEVL